MATLVAANLGQGYTPVNQVMTSRDVCQETTPPTESTGPASQTRVDPSRPGPAQQLPDGRHQETAAAKSILFTPHLHRKFFEKNSLFPLEGLYAAAELSQDDPLTENPDGVLANLGDYPLTVPRGLRVGHVTRYTTHPPHDARRMNEEGVGCVKLSLT